MASRCPAGRWCNCGWNATRRWARRTGRCRASRWRKAKSVRGNVGVAADAGFRLTPERTQCVDGNRHGVFSAQSRGHPGGVSPERPGVAGDDARGAAAADRAGGRVSSVFHRRRHRLRQQRDQLRRFPARRCRRSRSSCRTNISTSNSPARTSATGRRPTDGYVVQLHTPVSGAYTLLATYERPFKPQGETLAFTGARPLDAQSEQGHTLIISAYQFQVKPVDVSPGLLPLETGRSAGGIPAVLRRADSRGVSLHVAAVQSEARAQSAGAGRFAQPGGGPRVAHDAHFQGRPGADGRALFREEPRQSAISASRCRRERNCGRRR